MDWKEKQNTQVKLLIKKDDIPTVLYNVPAHTYDPHIKGQTYFKCKFLQKILM